MSADTDIVLGDSVVELLGTQFPTEPLPPCRLADGVVLHCAQLITLESLGLLDR